MDNKQIIREIESDINQGIYDMFPVLKRKLKYISKKLLMSNYIVNDDYKLSAGEIKILKKNEYYVED